MLAGFVLSFAVVGRRTGRRDLQLLGFFVTAALGLAFLSTEFQTKGIWLLAAGATLLLNRATVIVHTPHWRGARHLQPRASDDEDVELRARRG